MLKFVLVAREMKTHKRIVLVFDSEEDLLLYTKNRGLSIIVDEAYQKYLILPDGLVNQMWYNRTIKNGSGIR